jgi:hypothetical protein
MLRWARCGFHKTRTRTCYAELMLLHLLGFVGHVVHFSAFGARNINTVFFMLVWARCGFPKKFTETRYAKLVFLHPVGSAGHVVHSDVSRA